MSLDKQLGNNKPNKYKFEMGGFSLGAADAQNLLVHAVHVRALRELNAGKINIKAIEGSQTATKTLAKIKKRMDIYLGNKKECTEFDQLSRLKMDLNVWGAPGIYAADNKSTCVILDKFNMAPDVSLQFSDTEGDRIAKVATRLGSLGKHKKLEGTAKDFRPKGDSFQRVKVSWVDTSSANKHGWSALSSLGTKAVISTKIMRYRNPLIMAGVKAPSSPVARTVIINSSNTKTALVKQDLDHKIDADKHLTKTYTPHYGASSGTAASAPSNVAVADTQQHITKTAMDKQKEDYKEKADNSVIAAPAAAALPAEATNPKQLKMTPPAEEHPRPGPSRTG